MQEAWDTVFRQARSASEGISGGDEVTKMTERTKGTEQLTLDLFPRDSQDENDRPWPGILHGYPQTRYYRYLPGSGQWGHGKVCKVIQWPQNMADGRNLRWLSRVFFGEYWKGRKHLVTVKTMHLHRVMKQI